MSKDTRKVIQIAVANTEDHSTYVALCDDSTIWDLTPSTGPARGQAWLWRQLPPVPGTEAPSANLPRATCDAADVRG